MKKDMNPKIKEQERLSPCISYNEDPNTSPIKSLILSIFPSIFV